MVRINLVPPEELMDQHLIAEYNEILMLLGHVKKHPQIRNQPQEYKLGKGHITFFKDKLLYIKKRHEILKKEMIKREYKPTKTINLQEYPEDYCNDWIPKEKDFITIRKRISEKIKLKPTFYTYKRKSTA